MNWSINGKKSIQIRQMWTYNYQDYLPFSESTFGCPFPLCGAFPDLGLVIRISRDNKTENGIFYLKNMK